MEKIPTIFDRNWEGNCGIIDKPIPECEWVFKGEGIATEKVDGTNIKVKIEDGLVVQVWKRKNPNREQKKQGIEPWYVDANRDDPQDKHIFKAVDGWSAALPQDHKGGWLPDGEYPCEAYGGKIQGNPLSVEPTLYFFTKYPAIYGSVPRDFHSLKVFLSDLESLRSLGHLAEGIVFHHPDGRMAKIKRKDFK